ncbi:MAG: hypothetical protein LBG58_15245 [Planctomycetaceae bacterium]|jgi:photosystem II stability/assembly factor-like uncharacterized protein|nr:hypothetical protein [Planctomycetaceae bacterium]
MNFTCRIVLIIVFILVFVGSALFVRLVSAQSHLQQLIQTYKNQNPQAIQHRNAPPHNLRLANVPRSETTASGIPTTEMPVSSPSSVNTVLSVGDPRDPLNFRFAPYSNSNSNSAADSVTNQHVSPYDEMHQDARLNDLFFVNADTGWAVGDRGTIWNTQDGGTTWILQKTPIACTLRSVCFLDSSFGFAVGGYYYPFSTQGRGVVLSTHDGGKNWAICQTPNLPVLHRVKILDSMRILLAGESSEYHPTGLFLTLDAGRIWKTIFGGKTEGWTAADFFDEKTGFGIGKQGTALIFQNETILSQTPSFDSARLADLKLINNPTPPENINGWMVGDNGLILSTLDRGSRWSVAPGKLPGHSDRPVDLNTVEALGKNIWVAGNPGTIIYSSADSGKTWKATPSGVSTVIRKIVFADPQNGWAVGDLGTILRTNDGGTTWKTQRTGGSRLALLGFFGRAEDLPLEAYAALCAHQGYFGGAVLLFRDEDRKIGNRESAPLDRIHEAVVRVGACGIWELGAFPLKRKELQTTMDMLIRQLQKENDGKGIQRIRERIVGAIRLWRPEIILTAGSGSPKEPVRELVLREVMESVRMADDPTAFPYQLTELGLTPWKVKKVHVAQEDGILGDVNLATTEPSIRLGQPIDELAFTARGLIELQQTLRPTVLGFTTPYDEVPPAGYRDFFAGINIVPGSEARRGLIGSYAEQWDAIQLRTKQRRQTLGIIQHTAKIAKENGRSSGEVRLASHASELTRKIDPDAAVQVLFEMGQNNHNTGDWESALEAFDIIAKQYTGHPFARHAFHWLLQYYAAEETGWRKHKSSMAVNSQTEYKPDYSEQAIWGHSVVETSNKRQSLYNRHQVDPRLEKGLAIGRYLEQHFPDLADEMAIRFSLASVLRRCGMGEEALKYYRMRGDLKFDDVWGMRARGELWLGMPDKSELPAELRESPVPAIRCSYTSTKPFLDGKFDKQFDQGTWFNGKLYSLTPETPRLRLQEMLQGKKTPGLWREEAVRSASQRFGSQVMFMYDKQYLYLGIRCQRVPEFSYPPVPEKPRSRDSVSSDQDRVEILLDIDRDYSTYYSLTIDSRGWVSEACWGDLNWNPDWYVARHEDKDSWYIEAAIPLESLTDQFPVPQTVWAIGVRRIVPDRGVECWNAENSFNLTEGFGLLVFE